MSWTRRLARRLRALAAERGAGSHNVNVVDRANVVVSANVGEPGSWHHASSSQTVRVRQRGGVTDEVTHEGDDRQPPDDPTPG